MEYKALVSRAIQVADESIEIIVDSEMNFDVFKEQVKSALELMDDRANLQMFRLFQDTNLTDVLTLDETIRAEYAANIMYPSNPDAERDLGSGEHTALKITKVMASGEIVQLFLHSITSNDDINAAIDNIWNLLDNRLVQTNKRELDFQEYIKTLSFETKLKIQRIMEILYGRAFKDSVISSLKEDPTHLPNGVVRLPDESVNTTNTEYNPLSRGE